MVRSTLDPQRIMQEVFDETTGALRITGNGTYAPAASASTSAYVERAVRTAGNITVNSATWIDLNTSLDLPLTASAGQWVEVGVSGRWDSDAVSGYLDAVSWVSAAAVNSWGGGTAGDASYRGVAAWTGQTGIVEPVSGSVLKQVVAGDLDAGVLTIRFRVRTESAANKVLNALTTIPLQVWARNHG